LICLYRARLCNSRPEVDKCFYFAQRKAWLFKAV